MNRPVAEPPVARTDDVEDVAATNPSRRRVRFELIFAAIWLVVGLLLVVGLVALLAYVAVGAQRNATDQAQLRNDVLCPLYGIFLGSYNPKTRDNNPDPAARAKYEDAFVKIRDGWNSMNCSDPIVPPRSD